MYTRLQWCMMHKEIFYNHEWLEDRNIQVFTIRRPFLDTDLTG